MSNVKQNEPNFDVTPPLVLRQRAIICDHVDATRSLMSSVPHEFYEKIARIGKTHSGRPRPSYDVDQWFAQKSQADQAKLIGKIVVINVNISYAIEHGLKLLLSISKIKIDSRGSKGHNLLSLFRLLPDEIKTSMCSLYKNIDSTDLEFEECFSESAILKLSKNCSQEHLTLLQTLEYFQS